MLALFLAVINSPEDRFLFETVYYEYRGLMLNIAKGMLHDHHLAEDAVSESFWRIAKSFDKVLKGFKDSLNKACLGKADIICPQMCSFVVIVVKNVTIDMLRKRRKEKTLFEENEQFLDCLGKTSENCCSAEDFHLGKERIDEITNAVDNLSDTLRHTLYLYVVLELSIEEISCLLGCSYETVKKRIQRGRKELQKMLGESDDRA